MVFYIGSVRVSVDDGDSDIVSGHSWYISNDGYPKSIVNGRLVAMHRVIAPTPRGLVVHHKNGDRCDNRRSNLQILSARCHAAHHRSEADKLFNEWLEESSFKRKCKEAFEAYRQEFPQRGQWI